MSFDYRKYDLERLTHDEDEKIATLAEAILHLMEERDNAH